MTTGTLMFYSGICGMILCTLLLITQLLFKKKIRNRLLREISEE